MIALPQKKIVRPAETGQAVPQVTPPSADAAEIDEPYEVKRRRPSLGDSFVGGLDVLTVHQQLASGSHET